MEEKKISVIIPVYNTRKYLRKCICSILHQTYKNLEILLIDDGSTDKSVDICKKISNTDSRIRMFSMTHQGVSAIRNFGLSQATGEYVYFVDSDDWISNDAIEKLYHTIIDENVQLAVGIVQTVSVYKPIYFHTNLQVVDCKNKKELANVVFMRNSPIGYMAAKLYAKKIIDENKLRFHEEMQCFEDACFTYEYLKFCEKISFVNDIVYFYNRISQTAATRQYQPERKIWEGYMYEKQIFLFQNENVIQSEISKIFGDCMLQRFENMCDYYVGFVKDIQECILHLQEVFELYQKCFQTIDIYKDINEIKRGKYWELLTTHNYNDLEQLIIKQSTKRNQNSKKQILKKYIKRLYEVFVEFYWIQLKK